jgi:hypothetical protein
MNIQALIDFLRPLDPEREAVVTFFKLDGTGESYDIEELSNHEGDAQLEIYEAEPEDEEHPGGEVAMLASA